MQSSRGRGRTVWVATEIFALSCHVLCLSACVLGGSSKLEPVQGGGGAPASAAGDRSGGNGTPVNSTGNSTDHSTGGTTVGSTTASSAVDAGSTGGGTGGTSAGVTSGADGTSQNADCSTPSFPGAEGFGACASGGRIGVVLYVTNLNDSGPGSLQAALDHEGARYILFKVSGVINSAVTVRGGGNVTVAGQTSPGGIVVKGVLIENTYEPNNAHNIIIRGIRSRQGELGDGLRIGGAHDVIVDHSSFENSSDEQIEISRSRNVTVQRSILGEHVGDHEFSGMLINYSKSNLPLDRLSIHHNAWIRVMGRYPEITCEENGDGPGGIGTSNCKGVVRRIELTNNLFFDPMRDGIVFNTCVSGGNDCAPYTSSNSHFVHMNFVNNLMRVRSGENNVETFFGEGRNAWAQGQNQVHFSGNRYEQGSYVETNSGPAGTSVARFDYPGISTVAATSLIANLQTNCGALPSDQMDRRLLGYIDDSLDSGYTPYPDVGVAADTDHDGTLDAYEFDWTSAPAAPADGDGDGMPDVFELANGLDPNEADHNQLTLSQTGFTNLEVYLNSFYQQ